MYLAGSPPGIQTLKLLGVSGVSGTKLWCVASQSWLNTGTWEIFPYSMLDVSKLFGVPSVTASGPPLSQDRNLHIEDGDGNGKCMMIEVWKEGERKEDQGKGEKKEENERHESGERKKENQEKRKWDVLKLLETQHRFSLEDVASACSWWITCV